MVFRLSEDQYKELQRTFELFDTDRDGLITAADLQLVTATGGRSLPAAPIREYLEELACCIEDDGALDLPEFIMWVSQLSMRVKNERRLEELEKEEEMAFSIRGHGLNAKTVKVRDKLKGQRERRETVEDTLDSGFAEDMQEVFNLFDADKKGYVSWEDLDRVAKETGEEFDVITLDKMMSIAVAPGEPRRLNFQQFCKLMQTKLCFDEKERFACQEELVEREQAKKKAKEDKRKRELFVKEQASQYRRSCTVM